MSYLNALRLHFAGQFQANVSTVNNDPAHFDNAAFQPDYQTMLRALLSIHGDPERASIGRGPGRRRTSLLLTLHEMFNGRANREQFNRAIGLMMSLEGLVKAMMAGIPNSAVAAGPSFEYQPTIPSIT